MKNLSCLEADVLIYIFAWGDDNGVNEDELISDYLMNLSDLPWCCFDTSNVLRICNHCLSSSDDKEYSDAQMNMIIKYVLIQLKSKGLIKEKDNHYTTTVEYDDITNLLKNKASNCSCFHDYVKQAFDYLEQDALTYILGDENDNLDEAEFEETLSNCDEVAPIIRQSILSNTSDKEISKIFNHFTNAHVITMSSSGKPYKFLPVFATVFDDSLFLVMTPLFRNELGDEVALVFKRNENQSFAIVTDETTETIFGLYQAAKERDINGK